MINRKLENESKVLLQKFIIQTLVFLEHLVVEGFDMEKRPLFLEGQSDLIKGAWEEFHSDFDVEKANMLIKRAEADKFQSHGDLPPLIGPLVMLHIRPLYCVKYLIFC